MILKYVTIDKGACQTMIGIKTEDQKEGKEIINVNGQSLLFSPEDYRTPLFSEAFDQYVKGQEIVDRTEDSLGIYLTLQNRFQLLRTFRGGEKVLDQHHNIVATDTMILTCPECEKDKPGDLRVRSGMKCTECAGSFP